MATAEETYKVSRETGWAVLARELADRVRAGSDLEATIRELTIRRQVEQQHQDRLIQFAALGRMIGDANANDKPLWPILDKLAALRAAELGQPHTPPPSPAA